MPMTVPNKGYWEEGDPPPINPYYSVEGLLPFRHGTFLTSLRASWFRRLPKKQRGLVQAYHNGLSLWALARTFNLTIEQVTRRLRIIREFAPRQYR